MSETNETPEPVVKTIEELTAEVADLTAKLADSELWRTRNATQISNLKGQVSSLEEYLNENWDDLDEHAEAIAELFGIDTEVEKEVQVEISGTMTIKAPRSFDWDDIKYTSFDVSIDTSWSSDFSIESYDLDVNDTTVQE
jgi:predicted RNase H-like nuclease (RuvC/YqgF family)